MIVRSDIGLLAVLLGSLAAGVAAIVLAMFFLMAGITVLTNKGYRPAVVRTWAAVAGALLPVGGSVPVLLMLSGRPSPPGDVLPSIGAFACFLLILPGAVLYWAVARRAARRERGAGGPRRRRFRYGLWGSVTGWATVPAAGLGWWLGNWELALRIVGLGVLLAVLLYGYERRQVSQVDPAAAAGPEVLYLRGFTSDGVQSLRAKESETAWASGSAQGWVTFEQFLAGEIGRRLGGLVALGSPRDLLPPGGAPRVYPAGDWRAEVIARAASARAVLMQPEASESMLFELRLARAPEVLPRFFIITAPTGRTNAAGRLWWGFYRRLCGWQDTSWPAFAALLRAAGFRDVDDDPGPGAVITFEPDGRRTDLARDCRAPRQFVDAITERLGAAEAA